MVEYLLAKRVINVFWACLLALAFIGLLAHSTQGTLVSRELYPSCNGHLPANFSYAKGSMVSEDSFPCISVDTGSKNLPPPHHITWYSYNKYPPLPCGQPNLPAGDQCCHTVETSTIEFYSNEFIEAEVTTQGIAHGVVTHGKYVGQSATWTLSLSTTNLARNCKTAFGQEAQIGSVSLTIVNGPSCLNGGFQQEVCPGWH